MKQFRIQKYNLYVKADFNILQSHSSFLYSKIITWMPYEKGNCGTQSNRLYQLGSCIDSSVIPPDVNIFPPKVRIFIKTNQKFGWVNDE